MTVSNPPPVVMLTIATISSLVGCDPRFLVWLTDMRLATFQCKDQPPDDGTDRLMSLEEAAFICHIFSCRLKNGESPEKIVSHLLSDAPDDPVALRYATRLTKRYLHPRPDFSVN